MSCFPHGDFIIPSAEKGWPVYWRFTSMRKNQADGFMLGRLHFCPACKEILTLNTRWSVKNCSRLHGDFRVDSGIVTFDCEEPDYEIVEGQPTFVRTVESCPTCNGWVLVGDKLIPMRETVGMKCETCGTDYGPKDG